MGDKKKDDPLKGALGRTNNDVFKDVITGKDKSVTQWQEELKADRARRRRTTGVYNPRTGEREYSGR